MNHVHILWEVGEGATRWEQVVGDLEQKTSRRAPPPPARKSPRGTRAEEANRDDRGEVRGLHSVVDTRNTLVIFTTRGLPDLFSAHFSP